MCWCLDLGLSELVTDVGNSRWLLMPAKVSLHLHYQAHFVQFGNTYTLSHSRCKEEKEGLERCR